MKKLLTDFGLLRRNRDFRSVFIARTISLLGLGMLSVAVPMQIHMLTGDPLQVGLAMALEGAGMLAGMLLGGVLADRHDRRTLILSARLVCGLGFAALAANAWLPAPSLWAVYLLSAWDGFFGALGVTALLACMPAIVGRDNVLQARAISMVTVRLATVLSPAIGGIVIAGAGVGWAYMAAAIGTGLTLLPLLRLPAMRPQRTDDDNPLQALAGGVRFLLTNQVVAFTALASVIVTLGTAVRVLFPSLAASSFGGAAFETGLMYSAVPLGATVGALLSGWTGGVRRPGLVMQLCALAAFGCLMLLGVNRSFPVALALLAVFGYLVSVASLLQYALVQGHTPDSYLGRVNGLWSAQDAAGDTLGTLGIGLLGKLLAPLASVLAFGAAAAALGLALLGGCRALRDAPLRCPALAEDGD
ncbi:MAG: enterobactin transporter EntS [Burkholderiaceae bacterium]|nr:enterobactin transporter EntS [Burkholderiaceae bacterium]